MKLSIICKVDAIWQDQGQNSKNLVENVPIATKYLIGGLNKEISVVKWLLRGTGATLPFPEWQVEFIR